MTLEVVTVIAGGVAYPLWSAISIDLGAEAVARTASLVCAHPTAGFGEEIALMPDVTVVERGLVHKLFWIVDGRKRRQSSFRVLVDGVTGAFHVLRH